MEAQLNPMRDQSSSQRKKKKKKRTMPCGSAAEGKSHDEDTKILERAVNLMTKV